MTFRSLFLLGLWLTSLATAPLRADEAPEPRRLEGEIAGARWIAIVPDNWNNRLLLEAPDRRHIPDPLVAELDAATPDHQALLATGWALATTSYRRTGPILIDAIDDLLALRDRLATEIGQPRIVLVAGTGMGGLIATLIAEKHSDEFHGALAIDPKLQMRDPRALRLKCDHQPRGPLLLLFGLDSARGVIDYNDHARAAANAESTVPVLWFQQQPGTDAPDAAPVTFPRAVEALAAWVQTRRPPESRLENLPVAEDLPAEDTDAAPESAAHAEAPLLPDEPPPTVPVDDAPAAK